MKRAFTLILSLFAFSAYAQVPNGGMENWHNYTANGEPLEAPDSWYGSDEATFWADTGLAGLLINPVKQVFKSGNIHGGTAAARLESLPVFVNGTYFTAAISTGPLAYLGLAVIPIGGGIPVSQQIPYVYAWVRYTSDGNDDTASMVVTAYMPGSNGDSVIGTGTVNIPPATTYTNIGTAVQYSDPNATPTKINITFYSSAGMIGGSDVSTLWVDDVTWSTASVNNITDNNVVKRYPNPSAGLISIFNTSKEPVTIKAFAMNGQEIAQKQFTGNNTLDLTAQPSGLYFFSVTNQAGQTVQHGKLTIAK